MWMDAKLAFNASGNETMAFNATSDYIDLKAAGYFDAGRPMYLNIQAVTTFTGVPTITLSTDSTAAFSGPVAKATVAGTSGQAAGTVIGKIPLPAGLLQYIRLVGSVATVGTWKAWLSAS